MCSMISGLFIGSNDGRPPQAYKEIIVSLKLFFLVGWGRSFLVSCLANQGLNCFFYTSDFQWCCLAVQGSPTVIEHVVSVESLSLIRDGTF